MAVNTAVLADLVTPMYSQPESYKTLDMWAKGFIKELQDQQTSLVSAQRTLSLQLEDDYVSADTALYATVTTDIGVVASDVSAVATRVDTIEATLYTATTGLVARVTTVESVAATANSVSASVQTEVIAARQGEASLTAKVTALASATSTVDGKLTASYGIAVDAGGRIASLKLLSNGTTSSIEFLATTFKVYNGTTTETPFEISGGVVKIKTANVGVLTAANISVSNLSAISADLGTVTAGSVRLTSGSYAVHLAAGFGVSSDLILWFGASSTAASSATKTNGKFALATDGKVYYGTTELFSGTTPFDAAITYENNGVFVTAPDTAVITVTVGATGGVGSYTYSWTIVGSSSGMTPSGTSTASLTLSKYYGTGGSSDGETWECAVTDSEGRTLTVRWTGIMGSI